MPARLKLKGVSGVVGKRLASRPATAGIRRALDHALDGAGVEAVGAYRNATEYASHRDVVLAVAAGKADVGLTTLAWARAANLRFVTLGREAYELAIPVHWLGDPRVVGLCEAAQSLKLRKRLRDVFGYDVKQTGSLRIGEP
jgi:molybdate-binding protein